MPGGLDSEPTAKFSASSLTHLRGFMDYQKYMNGAAELHQERLQRFSLKQVALMRQCRLVLPDFKPSASRDSGLDVQCLSSTVCVSTG